MAGVLVAGNLVFDILTRPVDRLAWGTTTWVDSIEQSLGGNGANTSFALARLGVPVRLLGAVGADPFGDYVLGRLAGAGVDLSHIRRFPEPTATTVALVNHDGRRAFLHRPGCSVVVFPAPVDFDPGFTGGCTHFHLANMFALPRMRLHAAEWLARARRAGLSTSVDTGWDARGQWMEVLGPCLPHTDLLFVNEDEARALTGHENPAEAARFFRRQGAGVVILKLGARGCEVHSRDTEFRSPAFNVPVVDTTGAGDCFASGFLAARQCGARLEEAARLANAAGALSVRSLGAVEGLLGYEETLRWMSRFADAPAS